MQHLVKTAAVGEVTERGQFSALAATWSVDRTNEQIRPGAFRRSISRWQESGRSIPLHWNHSTGPADIIGSIDPQLTRETSEGLVVEGRVDLEDSTTAREAWRSMKRDRLALSFGYVVNKERKRGDGVTELLELDLFEISVVPRPANPATRFLSVKGTDSTAPSLRNELLSIMEAGARTPDGRRAVPDVVQKADWERLSGSSGRLDSDRDQRRRFAALTGDAKAAPPQTQDESIRIASFEIR